MKKHKKPFGNLNPEKAKSSPAKKSCSQTYTQIDRATAFKQDFKRIYKGQYRSSIEADLMTVLAEIKLGKPLDLRYRDHGLGGAWVGYRDCHLHPDLILIYKIADETLFLARLGSHSEIFG